MSEPVTRAVIWVLLLCMLDGIRGAACAQGTTSAAIAGRILDEQGRGLSGVDVTVTNHATGVSTRGVSKTDGRYLMGGLEVGGPYSVTARRIGSPVQARTGLFLTVGQRLQVDVAFDREPVRLEAVQTQAQTRLFSRAHMGTETFLSDSVIHRMPVINRDLYDLVRLVPQMSTWFMLAPSGAGTRVNSIRIDGVSDQVPSSNLAAGQLYGGKVIPLEAVKEYQVLFSPFDVRQGGFAGASINVVTRSGTNDLHGSLYAYGTNERLGRDVPFIRSARYDKQQFGVSLGGPIVRDRILFFLSSELQRRRIPAIGPYLGQPLTGQSEIPVSAPDIARFQQLLSGYALDGGSAGAVTNANPSSSTFLRLDAPIPLWNSRITVRGNYGHADSSIFARPTVLAPANCSTSACFPLSSLQHSRWVDKRSIAIQFISNFSGGAYNELHIGYDGINSGFRPSVKEPLILVTVAGTSGAPAVLQAGTHEIATGQSNTNRTAEITDNLSISAGAHRITMGFSAERADLHAFQLRGSYGIWEFGSLDSLQTGTASRYRVTRDTGSVTAASGAYQALYVGDEWEASHRLSLTFGIRGDRSLLSAHPPYVAAVDSMFHVRTDAVPAGTIAWSPRLGFNYRLTGDQSPPAQVRGGAGLFTGRPPLFWLFGGFSAYGLAMRTLQCGSLPGDVGPPPMFSADIRNPPLACAGGQTFGGATTGEIDVIDQRLALPQTMRVTLAVDAHLAGGLLGTIEGLYTRATRATFFAPINLGDPVAADRHGRVMYGTISATGVATPVRIASSLGDVITITNHSGDYAYNIVGELRKESRLADLTGSFSLGRARDVQSPRPVSALLIDNWRFARPVAGRQDDFAVGTSDFDQTFQVRASGTLRSPWRRFSTDVSFFYVGGSGFPYTYVTGGTAGRGDLNADGAVGNDPIYIPRAAFDTAEIRFAGSAAEVQTQQTAFERFIDGESCLHTQEGRIMARNSCRSPWMNLTNLAVRQSVPSIRDHSLVFELQVFNVLNLLNPRWGRIAFPTGSALASTNQIALLSQVGETQGPGAQPIYRFDSSMQRYSYENLDTYYQLQVAVRYNF
ncbi:MAG: carboxypeptidase regulatory-like domain-containing protein [Gemmatimonadaceae bacterium]